VITLATQAWDVAPAGGDPLAKRAAAGGAWESWHL